MSTPKKLIGTASGQPETPLQKLKAAWLRLPDATQDYWREQFASSRKQSDLRAELAKKLAIKLSADSALTKFRNWLDRQDKLDEEGAAAEQDEQQIRKQFGDQWTLDQIREEVLKRSYARAMATGDFAAGRKTIVQDLNVKKISLDERKLVILEKKAAAFDRAQELLTAAKTSKGGITKETIQKIEAELNLL
jgi:hypothetical protein